MACSLSTLTRQEMSVSRGDKVRLLGPLEADGWVLAQLEAGVASRRGLVPYSYLSVAVPTRSSPSRAAPPPPPTATPVVATAPPVANLAVEHAECAVCYDNMHSSPAAALTKQGKRVCRHFFHAACAKSMRSSGIRDCPVCRAAWSDVLEVPSFETNPRGWFKAVDLDGNGKLSRIETLEILKAICPVDFRLLEAQASNLWARWDRNGDGELSFAEIAGPDGLLKYVKATFTPQENKQPPALTHASKHAWFAFWDEDFSESLEQEEVTRALIKTFNLGQGNIVKLNEMRQTVAAIWPLFDLDGSGSIDLAEFIAPDGLGDTIIANMQR